MSLQVPVYTVDFKRSIKNIFKVARGDEKGGEEELQKYGT